MATASFDKSFVVTDRESVERIRQDLTHPRQVKIIERDYKAESARGIQLLKQRLSNSKTC